MYRKIKYRKVTKKYISQITTLFKKIFNKKISKEFYDWRYKNKNVYNSYIALKNNKVIAHIGYVEYRFFKKNKVYSRHSSFVDKNFRGQGIYSNLLKFSFTHLKNKTNFIIVWPNKLNLKNNLKFKNFFLIQKYYLYTKTFKNIKQIKLNKILSKNFYDIEKKNLNSIFIKDKKYILWRFFSYRSKNYINFNIDKSKKKIILQKAKYNGKIFYYIADYFDNSIFLKKIIPQIDSLKINYKVLIASDDKKMKKFLSAYGLKKENYVFNVGIFVLKKNEYLKKILIKKIKKNIKIADTDVFIETF